MKYDSEVVSYQLMSLTSWGICPINQMVSIMAQVIIISLLFTLKIKKILKELQTAIRIPESAGIGTFLAGQVVG